MSVKVEFKLLQINTIEASATHKLPASYGAGFVYWKPATGWVNATENQQIGVSPTGSNYQWEERDGAIYRATNDDPQAYASQAARA